MTNASRRITLQRSMFWRLVGGPRPQGLAVIFALFAVERMYVVLDRGRSGGEVGVTALVLAALVAVIIVGATSHAEADSTGVHWRYFRTHSYAWSEIGQISLAIKSTGIANVRHLILVRPVQSRGARRIAPAGTGGRARITFGRELLALAAVHGIAVENDWAR